MILNHYTRFVLLSLITISTHCISVLFCFKFDIVHSLFSILKCKPVVVNVCMILTAFSTMPH